jgi:exonuclease I
MGKVTRTTFLFLQLHNMTNSSVPNGIHIQTVINRLFQIYNKVGHYTQSSSNTFTVYPLFFGQKNRQEMKITMSTKIKRSSNHVCCDLTEESLKIKGESNKENGAEEPTYMYV